MEAGRDWTGKLDLDAQDPAVIGVARAFVRARLDSWGFKAFSEDAELITSELVTNSVLHAGGAIQLSLRVEASKLRLEVEDGTGDAVAPGSLGDEGIDGFGLALVAAVASALGVETKAPKRLVWAELQLS